MNKITCAIELLRQNKPLMVRNEESIRRIETLRGEIKKVDILNDPKISVFCAGSIARGEYGKHSDLDLLLTYNGNMENAQKIEPTVKKELKKINDSLGYLPLSDSGRFLTLHPIMDLVGKTGSPSDDVENRFTVRLLLLLEGVYLNSSTLFDKHKQDIINNYFRDRTEAKEFLPYFILNDILRYWRTLCLNYEEYRLERTRPWRKKSINLKFSRMLTVFATVLPLVVVPIVDVHEFLNITNFRPLERMAIGINALNSDVISLAWASALEDYETFLKWKESSELEKEHLPPEEKDIILHVSNRFSDFLHLALTSEHIRPVLRKTLIL